MIKESSQEEDIPITNIYTSNIRKMLTAIKGEIDSNTIIVGDFNTPLTPMDRSSKERINKETQSLNETLDQVDLADVIRTFHPKATEFILFLCTQYILHDRSHAVTQIRP